MRPARGSGGRLARGSTRPPQRGGLAMRRSPTLVALALVATLTAVGTARADVAPLVRASGASPFAPGCNGAPQPGTLYPGAEVEPWVASNPADERNLVAVWQQDRWSNGGSQGNLTAHT